MHGGGSPEKKGGESGQEATSLWLMKKGEPHKAKIEGVCVRKTLLK
jgi:hypothetical protein